MQSVVFVPNMPFGIVVQTFSLASSDCNTSSHRGLGYFSLAWIFSLEEKGLAILFLNSDMRRKQKTVATCETTRTFWKFLQLHQCHGWCLSLNSIQFSLFI
ncbi:hypothetical protein ILYODFUR_033509 [Ilyodon furcidens]|uniref:Uncharacterized protein n=1 Tax=Ilyodon furcidens TaxID=33524 RepID=A0ABV0TNY3_9TELE